MRCPLSGHLSAGRGAGRQSGRQCACLGRRLAEVVRSTFGRNVTPGRCRGSAQRA